jgi:hypothetical protein
VFVKHLFSPVFFVFKSAPAMLDVERLHHVAISIFGHTKAAEHKSRTEMKTGKNIAFLPAKQKISSK